MKTKLKQLLKINYRHYICVALTILFLLLAIFYFKYAHLRIYESFVDLYNSFKFYLSELFEFDLTVDITVNEFTKQPFIMPFNLPNTWEEFKRLMSSYFDLLITKENFIEYINFLSNVLYYISKILLLLMPLFLLFILVKNNDHTNNNFNQDTKPLRIYKKILNFSYYPLKQWIKEFIQFIKENSIYAKIWAFIWCYSFNFITIIIEFIAYYLFFVCSFKLTTIYIQVLKFLMDISICLDFIPPLIWTIIGLFVFNIIRRNIGFDNLNHNELKNRGYLKERSLVTLSVGTMGKKKTTLITDNVISQMIIKRDEAFSEMKKIALEFPNFPWIHLENFIKDMRKRHKIFNLITCEIYIKKLMFYYHTSLNCDIATYKSIKRYIKKEFHLSYENLLFDYDNNKYSMYFDNGLYHLYLWEDIKDYAKLYFIYTTKSSLLISNYAIRTDDIIEDLGNFPLWNTDLFEKDSYVVDNFSTYSHIIDFDALRLGKKVIENNPNANFYEFGIIVITEIGKERGNNLELQEVKKGDKSANQKNDLFNYFIKMIRHYGTIRHKNYGIIVSDEQRPESLGADARDLAEIIHINECSDVKLAMPFFAIEDLIISLLISKEDKEYYNHRHLRGDNTLLMYLYHNFTALIYGYQLRVYNTFAYYKLDLGVESGCLDGKQDKKNYYLMFKKIYSKRFSTDCFSGFFKEKTAKSKIGLDDIPSFEDVESSFDELGQENSYFINDMLKRREKE